MRQRPALAIALDSLDQESFEGGEPHGGNGAFESGGLVFAMEPDRRDDGLAVGLELHVLDPLHAQSVADAFIEAPRLLMPAPDLTLVDAAFLVGSDQLDLGVEVLEHSVDVAVVEGGVVGADHVFPRLDQVILMSGHAVILT